MEKIVTKKDKEKKEYSLSGLWGYNKNPTFILHRFHNKRRKRIGLKKYSKNHWKFLKILTKTNLQNQEPEQNSNPINTEIHPNEQQLHLKFKNKEKKCCRQPERNNTLSAGENQFRW